MKNRTKITLAVVIVGTIIGSVPYYFLTRDNSEIKPIVDTNDSWVAERYTSFRDLKVVKAEKHMISTDHEAASKIGEEILAKGGNAVDAAIAAQMVLNVVEPQSSGIGGGAFLLYYDAKTKQTHYFNGRETAPALANSKIFLDNDGKPREFEDVVRGGMSVGTPGLLKMLKLVHEKYGKMPWEELFSAAIKIASDGFPMDERISSIAQHLQHFKQFDPLTKMYLKSDGTPLDIGTIIKNPELANTLTTISKEGIEPFYNGKIGEDIVAAVKKSKINPGYLEVEDLKKYQVKDGDLICSSYRVKYKVCSMPVPSSGGVALLQTLGILENFDLSALKPNSVAAIHLISEAVRLAYADRNYYVADVPNVPIKQMLDKEYLKSRSTLINMNRAATSVNPGVFVNNKISYIINNNAKELPSTTHLSIVDDEGNAIALTSSIEYLFGSSVMVDGFMLNNQLTDFSFVPEIDGKPVANRLEPGKQPRSSMTPTFIFDDKDNLLMVIGSPGGPRIIQYVLKAIIAHLDWNMDIQSAISLPNFVVLKDTLELEKRTEIEKLEPELLKMNHRVKITDMVSGITAITIGPDGLSGGADPRRSGIAVGN